MQDIFVTGAGIVSAIGLNQAETVAALRAQQTGIAPVRYLSTTHTEFPVGEVKQTNEAMQQALHLPETAIVNRTSLMGALAVREAVTQAALTPNPALRVALISGITVGGMDKSEQYYPDFLANDTRNAYIATHDCGACTEMIADYFGLFSHLQTLSTACSSAANAILLGARLIRAGKVDIVVAGGCECLTKFHLNGFHTLMILDTAHCKPFDAHRAGLNLGEGAAYIVLESEATYRQRAAEPIARLTGYANACDAYHQTASSAEGEGPYRSMQQALATAGLSPGAIDYINAHGTGTENNDRTEGIAIQRLFGASVPPVSSTKAFTGHTTSAAGGVEAVISLLALQHQFIPANLNFDVNMTELHFTPSRGEQAPKPLRHVLSNSFGFGGNDSSLIFSAL